MDMSLRCFEFDPNCEPLTERHLQALWYDRDMRPAVLFDAAGREVRVVDPGAWNLECGPDFKNATLEVGSSRHRLQGDVEIHLRPSDWTRHGHAGDPAYRNVVAHVVWADGPAPPTLPPSALSICVGKLMAADIGFSPEQIDLTGYPFARLSIDERPCRRFFDGAPDKARAILADAGRKRLAVKAKRFAQQFSSGRYSRAQAYYEALMETLGYCHNAGAFRTIARRVPCNAAAVEPDTLFEAYNAAACFVEWDMRGIRPNNSPKERLRAAAAFFGGGRLDALLDWRDFSPRGCRDCIIYIERARLMGRARAAAALANVLVPLALAERKLARAPDWLPPEDLSSPMRLTAFRMFGRDHNPRALYLDNGLLMQGLLQVHREFCLNLYPDCVECGIVAA